MRYPKSVREHLANGKLRLTQAQYRDLRARMHGENNGAWVMFRHFLAPNAEGGACVAITLDPSDTGTLTIWLTHIIEITSEEGDTAPIALEDLRYLADQVQTFLRDGALYPVHYLPCVTVEKGVTDGS